MGLKWKNEFEQLKALHDIELAKKNSELKILENELNQKLVLQEKGLTQGYALREKELASKHEVQLSEATSLLKLDLQQQIKQKELDYQRQSNELKTQAEIDKAKFQRELQDDNYNRLKDAMTKLHEEGNHTTEFTKELALTMLNKLPTAKTEHKYLSGDLSVAVDSKPE